MWRKRFGHLDGNPVNQELDELEADSARGSRRFLDLPTHPT